MKTRGPSYLEVRDRADRVARLIRERAKREWDRVFGGSTAFECFHLAHNWGGQSWLTPEQRRVCRLMRHLQEKSFEPGRLVDEWSRRTRPRLS